MRRTVSEPSLARHTGNVRDSDRCIGAAPPAVATGAQGRRSPRGAAPHAAATKAASAAAAPPSGVSGTNTWTGKKPSGSSKARTRPWCGSSAAASPATGPGKEGAEPQSECAQHVACAASVHAPKACSSAAGAGSSTRGAGGGGLRERRRLASGPPSSPLLCELPLSLSLPYCCSASMRSGEGVRVRKAPLACADTCCAASSAACTCRNQASCARTILFSKQYQ